jgi:hypothetical protein
MATLDESRREQRDEQEAEHHLNAGPGDADLLRQLDRDDCRQWPFFDGHGSRSSRSVEVVPGSAELTLQRG